MGIVSQFSSKQANYSTLTTFVKIFFVISSSPDASSLKYNSLQWSTINWLPERSEYLKHF